MITRTMTIIPKGNLDLNNVNNWRPITLLENCDYKLLSMIFMKRLQLVFTNNYWF